MKELNTPTTDELYSKIESLTDEIVELRKTGLNAIKIAEDLSYLKKKYETRVEQLQSSLKAAESVNEWISVEDRLPEEGKWYIGYVADSIKENTRGVMNVFMDSNHKQVIWLDVQGDLRHTETVTHWMPLPTNPI